MVWVPCPPLHTILREQLPAVPPRRSRSRCDLGMGRLVPQQALPGANPPPQPRPKNATIPYRISRPWQPNLFKIAPTTPKRFMSGNIRPRTCGHSARNSTQNSLNQWYIKVVLDTANPGDEDKPHQHMASLPTTGVDAGERRSELL